MLVVVAGRDPLEELAGDSTYARAHARAVMRWGSCPACSASVRRRPRGPRASASCTGARRPSRPAMLPARAPWLAAALARFLGRPRGPHLLHAIGPRETFLARFAAGPFVEALGRADAEVGLAPPAAPPAPARG